MTGPGIDFDSPVDWDNWYFNREHRGEYPWEVVRGGNSSHVDLFVEHDGSFLNLSVRLGKMTKEETILHPYGFYFEVAGKNREVEAIKFSWQSGTWATP